MLSGLEILNQIKKGNIVISDFDEARLNPNSYNIRLGDNLKIYPKAAITPDELNDEIAKRMESYAKEYTEICKDILNGKDTVLSKSNNDERNKKLAEIYAKKAEIGLQVLREHALDPKKNNETKDVKIPEEGCILIPGVLYLGETMEYTETYGFVPNIDGRSTTGRLGIEVHRTAGFGDNGFKGKWTLEITVTHPVIVYSGMEIGQLYYETIDGDSSMTYNGKYQNQQGVQAAKVDKTRE